MKIILKAMMTTSREISNFYKWFRSKLILRSILGRTRKSSALSHLPSTFTRSELCLLIPSLRKGGKCMSDFYIQCPICKRSAKKDARGVFAELRQQAIQPEDIVIWRRCQDCVGFEKFAETQQRTLHTASKAFSANLSAC